MFDMLFLTSVPADSEPVALGVVALGVEVGRVEAQVVSEGGRGSARLPVVAGGLAIVEVTRTVVVVATS